MPPRTSERDQSEEQGQGQACAEGRPLDELGEEGVTMVVAVTSPAEERGQEPGGQEGPSPSACRGQALLTLDLGLPASRAARRFLCLSHLVGGTLFLQRLTPSAHPGSLSLPTTPHGDDTLQLQPGLCRVCDTGDVTGHGSLPLHAISCQNGPHWVLTAGLHRAVH